MRFVVLWVNAELGMTQNFLPMLFTSPLLSSVLCSQENTGFLTSVFSTFLCVPVLSIPPFLVPYCWEDASIELACHPFLLSVAAGEHVLLLTIATTISPSWPQHRYLTRQSSASGCVHCVCAFHHPPFFIHMFFFFSCSMLQMQMLLCSYISQCSLHLWSSSCIRVCLSKLWGSCIAFCVSGVSWGSAQSDGAVDFTISAPTTSYYVFNILCVIIWAGSVLENPSQQYLVWPARICLFYGPQSWNELISDQ